MNKWDYSKQAESYSKRPNYSQEAIDELLRYTNLGNKAEVADIGAGTGNLTILLQPKVKKVYAVEPTNEMKVIGVLRTMKYPNIKWITGTGEHTTLPDNCVDMVTFGSSFNTTERDKALKEAKRILRPYGYFACMWNNRDLTTPTQITAESIIRKHCPEYNAGTRREQQADVILSSGLFNRVYYFEASQNIETKTSDYIEAWKSVNNPTGWDLSTLEGRSTFDKIKKDMKKEFEGLETLSLKYVTKVWIGDNVKLGGRPSMDFLYDSMANSWETDGGKK